MASPTSRRARKETTTLLVHPDTAQIIEVSNSPSLQKRVAEVTENSGIEWVFSLIHHDDFVEASRETQVRLRETIQAWPNRRWGWPGVEVIRLEIQSLVEHVRSGRPIATVQPIFEDWSEALKSRPDQNEPTIPLSALESNIYRSVRAEAKRAVRNRQSFLKLPATHAEIDPPVDY